MSGAGFASTSASGWLRFVYRLPVWLYRAGLGAFLGDRFLLLEHTGRISRKLHGTILVIARQNKGAGMNVVASAYGAGANWYRNLAMTPQATIQIGSKKMPVEAKLLSPDESGQEMRVYASQHPTAARLIMGWRGCAVNGTEDEYEIIGRHVIRFVALLPR